MEVSTIPWRWGRDSTLALFFYGHKGVLCILWCQAWCMVPFQTPCNFTSFWTKFRYNRAAWMVALDLMQALRLWGLLIHLKHSTRLAWDCVARWEMLSLSPFPQNHFISRLCLPPSVCYAVCSQYGSVGVFYHGPAPLGFCLLWNQVAPNVSVTSGCLRVNEPVSQCPLPLCSSPSPTYPGPHTGYFYIFCNSPLEGELEAGWVWWLWVFREKPCSALCTQQLTESSQLPWAADPVDLY